MSIETEFESTITNVKNAYQGLDNLGATIPQNKTIENIKSCLDEIYNKFPKTSYSEGTEITLSNTLKGKLDFEDGIVGYGDTKQYTTTGINLMDVSAVGSGTRNGITLTNNGDGTFTLNGTATAQNVFTLTNMTLDTSKTYTLTGCPSSGSSTTYFIAGANFGDYGSGATAIPNRESISFAIVTQSGAILNNVLFKPMLIEGSTQKPFEKYTGGTASPNPSYPQDIEVVRGKNLFDINNTITLTQFGITATTNNETGEITLNGTATQNAFIQFGLNTEIESGTILSLSANNPIANSGVRIRLMQGGGTVVGVETVLSNINAKVENIALNKKANRLQIRVESGTTLTNYVIKPQLEKGSQATSYLPYNTLEIEESGKNWFTTANVGTWTKRSNALNIEYNGTNKIKLSTGSSTYGYGYSAIAEYPAKIGKKYVISYKVSNKTNSSTADSNHILLNASEPSLTGGPIGSNTVIATDNKIWLYILLAKTSTETSEYATVDLSDIQIEEISESETEPTDYEPYKEPKTYQLSLGEYEFAKTDIPDKIIYDIANDKVYLDKNTRKVVFNGTETWTMTQTAVGYRFRTDLSGIKASASAAAIPKLYCDKLIANSLDNIWTIGGNCMGLFSNFGGVVVICLADLSIDTIDKFKTWLASNNLTAYLPLAETSREEITGTLKDQIKALYNAHSFTGTTIITSNGDLSLVLKVRALKGE